MSSFRFTKRTVDAIEPPTDGQVLYRDTLLRGFGLRVGAQSRVFFVEGQVSRRTKRVTIGRADVICVDEARKRAMSILSEMASRRPRRCHPKPASAARFGADPPTHAGLMVHAATRKSRSDARPTSGTSP